MRERSQTPKGQIARRKVLRAAETLLAARGFHGTSMRDVADACGLPLASVIYHFARKEKLYGAVLAEIAAQLLGAMQGSSFSSSRREHEDDDGGDDEVSRPVRQLIRWSLDHPKRVRLLVRELLDNPPRLSRAASLPLAPVLVDLAKVVGVRGHPQPELAVLHVVGAVSYVVIARPTVRRIVGADRDAAMMASYEEEALAFARAALVAAHDPLRKETKKTKTKTNTKGTTSRSLRGAAPS